MYWIIMSLQKGNDTIWMLTFCSLNPFKTIQRGTLLLQALFCLSVNYFFHKNLCRHQIFMGPVIPRQSPVLERVMYIHPKETLDKFMVIYWYSFSFVLILILLEALGLTWYILSCLRTNYYMTQGHFRNINVTNFYQICYYNT